MDNIFKRFCISMCSREKKQLLAILVLSFLIRLPFLNFPLESDTWRFVTIAKLMTKGAVLYKDIFEFKPPGIFFIFALLFKLFPASLFVVNLLNSIWWVFNTYLVYNLTKYLSGRIQALSASIFFSIFSLSPYLNTRFPFTENFLIFFVILGVSALFKNLRAKKNNFFLSGFYFGLGFLFKQIVIIDAVISVIFIRLELSRHQKNSSLRFFLKAVFSYLAGFFLPAVAVMIYFITKGAWQDLLFCVFTFNRNYIAAGYVSYTKYLIDFTSNTIHAFNGTALLWLAVILFTAKSAIKIIRFLRLRCYSYGILSPSRTFLLFWVFSAFLSIGLSGRFFLHYYTILLAPFSIISGIIFVSLWHKRSKRIFPKLFYGAAIILTIPTAFIYKNYLFCSPENFFGHIFNEPSFVLPRTREVGLYLKEYTKPNEAILNWSRYSEVFFYSDRKPATRYAWISPYSTFLYAMPPGTISEIAKVLEKNPPVYMVADTNLWPWVFLPGFTPVRDFFINHKYLMEKEFPVRKDGKILYALAVYRLCEPEVK